MRRRVAVLLALLPAVLGAQQIRSTLVPGRVDAPRVFTTDTTGTTSYLADGIPVIHRRGTANLVVMNLYLLGGVQNVTPGTAGIEPFYLAVSEQGTARYPKDALRRAMARTGSTIALDASEDWTLFGIRATTEVLDSVWSVFADRILHPRLDSAEIDFIRNQALTGLRQVNEHPDPLLERASDSIAFRGHAYGLSPTGSASSLAAITRDALLGWKRTQLVRSRMLLVVVGNISRARVERMVSSSIGTLPVGSYAWTMPDTLPTRPGSLAIIPRELPTNYLTGTYRGPRANDRDAPALRVATAVLSGQLFSEIRSKANLSYSASAPYRDRGLVSGGLYVTTTLPDSALKIMREQVRLMQEITIPTAALAPLIQQFLTEYFLDNETSTAQADFLARSQLYRGDWHAANSFMAELRGVTGADVRRVTRRYLRDVQWTYVGDPSRITRRLAESF